MAQDSPANPSHVHLGSAPAPDGYEDDADWVRPVQPIDNRHALYLDGNSYRNTRYYAVRSGIDNPTHGYAPDAVGTDTPYQKRTGFLGSLIEGLLDHIRNVTTDYASSMVMTIVTILQMLWKDPDPLFRYPETAEADVWRGYVRGDMDIVNDSPLGPDTAPPGEWSPSALMRSLDTAMSSVWHGPRVAVERALPSVWTEYHLELEPSWLTTPDPNPHGTRRPHGEDWDPFIIQPKVR